MLHGKVNHPGNKGERHTKKKNDTCPDGALQIFPCKECKSHAHHPCKEKAQRSKFDIGHHPRKNPSKEQSLTIHGTVRIFLLKITQGQIQSPQKEGKTDFLRTAAPVKTPGSKGNRKHRRCQHKCRVLLYIKLQNLTDCHQICHCQNPFQQKYTQKRSVGYQIGKPVKEIQIHSLLIKNIPVGNLSVKKPFPHRKIAVGVIPVVTGIEHG